MKFMTFTRKPSMKCKAGLTTHVLYPPPFSTIVHLIGLKLIVHVRRILTASLMPRRAHLRRHGRVLLHDVALFVSAQGVAAEVAVGGVEGCFCPFRCLWRGLRGGLAVLAQKGMPVVVHWTTYPDDPADKVGRQTVP